MSKSLDPIAHAIGGTHAVEVVYVVCPTFTGFHALALVHVVAGTHAFAAVFSFVGPTVTGFCGLP
jgi:hypothetical protein